MEKIKIVSLDVNVPVDVPVDVPVHLDDIVVDTSICKGEIPIMCDALICLDRGNLPRCYLDIYTHCQKYDTYKPRRK